MAPGREMKARSGEKEGLVTHPKGLSDVSAIVSSQVTTEDALQTDNDNSTLPTVVRKTRVDPIRMFSWLRCQNHEGTFSTKI